MSAREPYKGGPSAWDTIHTCHKIADGLYELTTASHGGYWVSPERRMELRRLFPGYEPWAGYPWLEEDCDWALAAAAWPELFSDDNVSAAVKTLQRGSQAARCEAYWKSKRGIAVLAIVERQAMARHGQWQVGSSSAGGETRGWCVWMRQIGTKARRRAYFEGYPREHFYTDEALAAATYQLGEIELEESVCV